MAPRTASPGGAGRTPWGGVLEQATTTITTTTSTSKSSLTHRSMTMASLVAVVKSPWAAASPGCSSRRSSSNSRFVAEPLWEDF